MGKIDGFKHIKRQDPVIEDPKARTKHFDEFVSLPNNENIENQSARCMDCGVPFCHSACPLGNLIPDFNHAVYQKNWKKAFKILSSTNNLPEITGRICPAPCEASCVLSINHDAVSIENIEKAIAEIAFENSWVKPVIVEKKRPHSIAIIGSGPTGLSCADELSKKGYLVCVYEKSDKIGGLLRYGIPDFKLSKKLIDRRIRILEQQGVTFITNTWIGIDIQFETIQNDFDALLLCIGSSKGRDLNIPGRSLEGIYFAMDFLTGVNKAVSSDNYKPVICKGKNVVVIGGGDTGSDCIGSAIRLEAKSVTQIELLAKPPVQRSDDNPWPEWPMVLKTSSSQEEGAEREWSIKTKKFISSDNKKLSGIEICSLEWSKDTDGKYSMTEIPGSTRVIPADLVFLAIGFEKPILNNNILQSGLKLKPSGLISSKKYKTNVDGVFVAGDARMGQSLVVHAIAEGRKAAEKISKFLNPEEELESLTNIFAINV